MKHKHTNKVAQQFNKKVEETLARIALAGILLTGIAFFVFGVYLLSCYMTQNHPLLNLLENSINNVYLAVLVYIPGYLGLLPMGIGASILYGLYEACKEVTKK